MDTMVERRFGRFAIQPARRQVLIDGEPAKIGSRAFDVLMALVERRERVVSKAELLDLVWPGIAVEENNLQVHIMALRKLCWDRTRSRQSRAAATNSPCLSRTNRQRQT